MRKQQEKEAVTPIHETTPEEDALYLSIANRATSHQPTFNVPPARPIVLAGAQVLAEERRKKEAEQGWGQHREGRLILRTLMYIKSSRS